jgi:hypothetical protein
MLDRTKRSLFIAIVITALGSACGDKTDHGSTTGDTIQASGGMGAAVPPGTGGSMSAPASNMNGPSMPMSGSGGSAAPTMQTGTGGMSSASGTGGSGSDAGAVDGGATNGSIDSGTATGECDRKCLLKVMQDYLDALVAHDPSKVSISPQVKMTDNGMPATTSDGLWKTASMLVADERLDYADPVTHNVGSQSVINEGSTPTMYEVRLKVDDGQITEIESMTVHQADAANGFFDPANLKPQPVFLEMPDPAKRMSRDQLMALQELYLDYLEGKKAGSDLPFDDNCTRYENGVATASGVASFNAQSWGFQVTRRVLILDEEAGITWGMFPFMQDDTALVVGEAFKLVDGKIMMIQAVMAYMPSKAWD